MMRGIDGLRSLQTLKVSMDQPVLDIQRLCIQPTHLLIHYRTHSTRSLSTEQPRLRLVLQSSSLLTVHSLRTKLATPAAAPTAPLRPQLPQAPSSCLPIPKQQPRCMRHWSRKVLLKISVRNTTSADLGSFSGPHSHTTSKANRQTKCSTMLPHENAEISGTQCGGSPLAVRKGESLSEHTDK
jgi:hypothetical protein